ncbi:MAG TPA: thiamine-phosphate kinase [Longimicrobiales bacterium]
MSRLASGPEFDFIRSVLQRAKTTHPLVRVGPGDDCAVIGDLAVSTDATVEGVHFRRDWLTADEIGWRATAASLSDLAAMAAEPIGILVSLVASSSDAPAFAADVMAGVVAAADAAGAVLLGGDTTSGDVLMLDVVAVGRTAQPVLRSGAQAGDGLWVTGALGGAAAAVAAWQSGNTPGAAARARYAHPAPRIREALWLRAHAELHALIDLSDGLFGDAAHLAAASACGIEIDAALVPVDRAAGATYQQAVSGGEDYELCFAAPVAVIESLRELFQAEFGSALTRVGTVTGGRGLVERTASGETRDVEQGGYQHFKEEGS